MNNNENEFSEGLLMSKEKQYCMNTYGRLDASFVRGSGSRIYDFDGKEYIDFTSGIAVNSIGYGDSDWISAVTQQLNTLQHISNVFYSIPAITLAEKLCKLSGFDKVFLCNSGAEANECAIKIARKYSFDRYGKGRSNILTLFNSFHGRTVTTLSATGQDSFHNYFFPFTGGFDYAQANDSAECIKKLDDTFCAVIMEGIQGEGGVLPLDSKFVRDVCEYCEHHDILVIFDEVQTGIGRTGKLFCFENYGVKPNIVTSAKGLGGGLPIGAVLADERTSSVLKKGDHGSTFGGNPVVCAGASVVLDKVTSDGFLDSVTEKGNYIREKLSALNGVAEIRGIGLMLGVKLTDTDAHDFAEASLKNGLAVLTAKTVVRLLPPLTITKDEIDEGIKRFICTLEG